MVYRLGEALMRRETGRSVARPGSLRGRRARAATDCLHTQRRVAARFNLGSNHRNIPNAKKEDAHGVFFFLVGMR